MKYRHLIQNHHFYGDFLITQNRRIRSVHTVIMKTLIQKTLSYFI
jgi:hypothetical protein